MSLSVGVALLVLFHIDGLPVFVPHEVGTNIMAQPGLRDCQLPSRFTDPK